MREDDFAAVFWLTDTVTRLVIAPPDVALTDFADAGLDPLAGCAGVYVCDCTLTPDGWWICAAYHVDGWKLAKLAYMANTLADELPRVEREWELSGRLFLASRLRHIAKGLSGAQEDLAPALTLLRAIEPEWMERTDGPI